MITFACSKYSRKYNLAQQLLADAKKLKPGTAEQYVLLREAHDQAALGGYLDLAFQSLDQAEARFEIDKLEWTTTTLEHYAKAEFRRGTVGWEALLDRLLALATEQMEQVRYAEAAKILAMAEKPILQWQPELLPRINDRRGVLGVLQSSTPRSNPPGKCWRPTPRTRTPIGHGPGSCCWWTDGYSNFCLSSHSNNSRVPQT